MGADAPSTPCFTSREKEHEEVLPAGSLAVQTTGVVPTGKLEPEAREQVTVAEPQESRAEVAKETWVPPGEQVLTCTGAVGQLKVGGVTSPRTFTLNWQDLVLPDLSWAVQVTFVSPTGKVAPEGCEHVTVAPPQLSTDVGA